jgi:tyrosyl-tRNA synthetase
MNLVEDLKARGLVEHTSAEPEKIFATRRTVYLGVDPSADSMQAGNLVVLLLMKRLADTGHNLVLLVGGGTGMIGDPRESGERQLADPKVIARNVKAIRAQMERIVGRRIRVVNNADWLLKVRLLDFLRDVGKHFTVNELVKRDIIRRRLETPDESISYTEFAYSLLQGLDYLTLYQKYGVDLQIGASDQWTNILSGVELIRRKLQKEAFAFTCPLVTDASGKKFGKSEGNAVWLDAQKTSPFAFYQFWLNQGDEMVEKYLKFYTFLSLEEITELMARHNSAPQAREAQKKLAAEVTALVHGTTAVTTAEMISGVLFGSVALDSLSRSERNELITNAPGAKLSRKELAQTSVIDALVASGLASSKGDARRLIEGKGVSIQGTLVDSPEDLLSPAQFTNDLALLKRGKQVAVLSLE